jgi:uncharacterized membrane protein
MMSTSSSKRLRINGIDALRGVAVLLMIEQHLGYWLWKPPKGPLGFSDFPFLFGFNSLGGLAAPFFVTLAGLSISLFTLRHTRIDHTLYLRGVVIMGFGYVLNILTPSWFSIGSWFILHMLGSAIILSPLLRRIPSSRLISLCAVVLISTVIIQNALDTPSFLQSLRMRRLDLSGGALRLALAEGQFPVFPWLFFFLMGMVAGRWLIDEKISRIIFLAAIFMSLGLILSIPYLLKVKFAIEGPFYRVFRISLGFYPASPPIVLFLSGLSLFSVVIFNSIDLKYKLNSRNPLVCLGRASLTLLLVHVVLVRELSHHLHFWKIFSVTETLSITIIVLALFTLFSIFWKKYEFRYGAEWLLRRVAG